MIHLALILMLSLAGGVKNNCTCYYPEKLDDVQFNAYQLIITGKIIKIVPERYQTSLLIEVDRYYKGAKLPDTITVLTPSNEGVCGLTVHSGEKWLVFATRKDDQFYTTMCTRTKPMNLKDGDYRKQELQEDIKFLEAKQTRN